jgi:hypothetical protein
VAVLAVIALIVIALEASPPLGGALLALVVIAGLLKMPHDAGHLGESL